jgi:phage recombination protein Bet
MATSAPTAATARPTTDRLSEAPRAGEAELAPRGATDPATLGFDPVTREFAKLANPDLNPEELRSLLFESMRLGLDPASGKQIYGVVYNRDNPQKRKLSIQIAIDGLRSIAARTGEYDGSDEVEDGPDVTSDGVKHPAYCIARVWRKGSAHPFVAKVRWEERRRFEKYGPRQGQLTDFWRDQPYGQLEKCAESAALRKAFPMEVRGLQVFGDTDDDDRSAAIDVEARTVRVPAAPASAPSLPAAPPASTPPVASPAASSPPAAKQSEVEEIARQISEALDDPGLSRDQRGRMWGLLNQRLDSRSLPSASMGKPEDVPFLRALHSDLEQIAQAR